MSVKINSFHSSHHGSVKFSVSCRRMRLLLIYVWGLSWGMNKRLSDGSLNKERKAFSYHLTTFWQILQSFGARGWNKKYFSCFLFKLFYVWKLIFQFFLTVCCAVIFILYIVNCSRGWCVSYVHFHELFVSTKKFFFSHFLFFLIENFFHSLIVEC